MMFGSFLGHGTTSAKSKFNKSLFLYRLGPINLGSKAKWVETNHYFGTFTMEINYIM